VKLHDLHPAPGSRKPARRVGRGHGSGRGKTAGRGTKGQKSRAGGNLPAWFEGGQTPLHVRTPKLHGFKNRFRVAYAPVNLAKLGDVAKGTLVTPEVLAHDGVIADTKRPVKILGIGDAPKGITIHAHGFSRSALDKLAAAGSTVQRLSWPDNLPVDEADAERAATGRKKGGRPKASAAPAASDEAAVDEPAAEAGDTEASATEAGATEATATGEAGEAGETSDEAESEPSA
jgi:large subunit ribosomal protein L15